jgi:hypothetical protein
MHEDSEPKNVGDKWFDHSEIEPGYRNSLDLLYSQELSKYRENPSVFEFGPVYHVSKYSRDSQVEEEVRVTQINIDDPTHPDDKRKSSVFIAADSNGKLLGHRSYDIDKNSEDGEGLKVTSNVQVGYRGKGLAAVLELINQDYLQRLADLGGKVKWVVRNANQNRLEELEQALERDPKNEDLASQVGKKRQEQEAWQYIWGAGGLAGVEQGFPKFLGEKYFNSKADFVKIKDIFMHRGADALELVPVIDEVQDIDPDSEPQVLEERRKEFESMLTQIEQIIK